MPRNPLGDVRPTAPVGAAIFTRPVVPVMREEKKPPPFFNDDPVLPTESRRRAVGRPKAPAPKRGVTVRLTDEGQERLLTIELELLRRGVRGQAASVTEIVEALLLNTDVDDLANMLKKKRRT